MKLIALRREDGIMMKLTEYDLIEEKYPCKVKKHKVEEFIEPDIRLVPEPYPGEIEADLGLRVEANNRDIAAALLENDDNFMPDWIRVKHGFEKSTDFISENESAVNAILSGDVYIRSIDGTLADAHKFNDRYLTPEEFTATIEGSGEE